MRHKSLLCKERLCVSLVRTANNLFQKLAADHLIRRIKF